MFYSKWFDDEPSYTQAKIGARKLLAVRGLKPRNLGFLGENASGNTLPRLQTIGYSPDAIRARIAEATLNNNTLAIGDTADLSEHQL